MKFIPTRIHGFIDYFLGVLLIISPWLFNFFRGGPESVIPIVTGSALIIYSFFTDYELGVVRVIPMPTHIVLDVLQGLFLAASPWLFQFSDQIAAPHMLIGLYMIGEGFVSYSMPRHCRTC